MGKNKKPTSKKWWRLEYLLMGIISGFIGASLPVTCKKESSIEKPSTNPSNNSAYEQKYNLLNSVILKPPTNTMQAP